MLSLLRSPTPHSPLLALRPPVSGGASAVARRKPCLPATCSMGDGALTVTADSRNQTSSSSSMTIGRPFVRPSPELGLLSLLFALSMAVGAVFALATVSIPTMNAFRRLATSMDKLSKVASEEIPGTLSSLKLSGLEINDLTQELSKIRQKISGSRNGMNGQKKMPKRKQRNPNMN
ncbi:hypothetical protein Scep_030924 [Stephania cephalantha]|uniref:Uncharacterized protein n=1 Tax=Stephania cephalantha TaxID=152367 RepID=A0AAP0E3Q8_9MAGN